MRCLFVFYFVYINFFSSLGHEALGPRTGCQFFKKMSILPLPAPISGNSADSRLHKQCIFHRPCTCGDLFSTELG